MPSFITYRTRTHGLARTDVGSVGHVVPREHACAMRLLGATLGAVLLVGVRGRPLRSGAEPCSASLVDGYVPPVTAFVIEPVEVRPAYQWLNK
jgi:hypothetical protein